ncbi:MAG: hypothetical protein Q8R35_03825 [bacterium]|nr:hypothetical protein [bacterium]
MRMRTVATVIIAIVLAFVSPSFRFSFDNGEQWLLKTLDFSPNHMALWTVLAAAILSVVFAGMAIGRLNGNIEKVMVFLIASFLGSIWIFAAYAATDALLSQEFLFWKYDVVAEYLSYGEVMMSIALALIANAAGLIVGAMTDGSTVPASGQPPTPSLLARIMRRLPRRRREEEPPALCELTPD